MKSYTITRTVSTGSQTIQGSTTVTAEASTEIEVALTSEQANKEITLAGVRANIAALVMVCDQVATVKINSSGGLVVLTLLAGQPYVYGAMVGDKPLNTVFAADITSLFVTNEAAVAATFKVAMLSDPTP